MKAARLVAIGLIMSLALPGAAYGVSGLAYKSIFAGLMQGLYARKQARSECCPCLGRSRSSSGWAPYVDPDSGLTTPDLLEPYRRGYDPQTEDVIRDLERLRQEIDEEGGRLRRTLQLR